MNRQRPLTKERLWGMGFVLAVLVVVFGIHSAFLLVWWPRLQSCWPLAMLLVYHVLFLNLLLAFYQCVMTDPGVVPSNWGFYMGDETKRRRYCKMCNVWKPDRTHHCGVCNRCVLNMDHHCPWINNCVGFYNRKFFIQLLVYVYLTLWMVILFSVQPQYCDVLRLTRTWNDSSREQDAWAAVRTAIVGVAFGMSVLLVCTLTNFIKFHMKLALDNVTTIENLEREEGTRSRFDVGHRRNLEQVFGPRAWMWWVPLHTQSSQPSGDGVRWRVQCSRTFDEDEEPLNAGGGQRDRLIQP
mmetsp:Transcript_107556/g.280845  ORF Transcript_107556/g.280845 Transcript_107556/m.280845 type:complete len:297 (-) Transcript_107556:37-927(-)